MNKNIYRTMKQKRLIIFIPSIEGGGVEKNLFIISNYLKDKINNISVITVSKKFRNKFNKKIKFISLKANFWLQSDHYDPMNFFSESKDFSVY